jgi:hypothetical protein
MVATIATVITPSTTAYSAIVWPDSRERRFATTLWMYEYVLIIVLCGSADLRLACIPRTGAELAATHGTGAVGADPT